MEDHLATPGEVEQAVEQLARDNDVECGDVVEFLLGGDDVENCAEYRKAQTDLWYDQGAEADWRVI